MEEYDDFHHYYDDLEAYFNETKFANEKIRLSNWILFRVCFSGVTLGIFSFMILLALTDSIKRIKFEVQISGQISLFFLICLLFDLIYFICFYILTFFPADNDYQVWAYTIEYGWMAKKSITVAIGLIQLLKLLSSSSNPTIMSLYGYIFESAWRKWFLITLPVGFLWPFLMLLYHITHDHISMLYEIVPMIISSILVWHLYRKTSRYSFHLSLDEICACKLCIIFLSIVAVESFVFFILEEITFGIDWTSSNIHIGILTAEIRAMLHECVRLLFPLFYLILFRTRSASDKILPNLNNPTLVRMECGQSWGSLNRGILPDSTSRARYDTEMNSLVFDSLQED